MTSPLFVLTSDLGTGSAAAAQLGAVLVAEIADAHVFELSHAIPPQSIRAAELALRSTAFIYPPGTLHIVVVDPDVGTDRRVLAVKARERIFIGPDNGVLGLAFKEPDAEVVSVDKEELWRHPVSNTFHGRDIFAPVAAKLAKGAPLNDVGTPIDDPMPSGIPDARVENNKTIVGESLGADRFGNLTTNIAVEIGDIKLGEHWHYEVDGKMIPYRSTYMAAKIGRMIVTSGADRFIEIAVTQGSAAETLGRAEGIEVHCASKR